MMARSAVAMSGGVDSTVTAHLLARQGHEVCGLFMALSQPDLDIQVARVQEVAGRLGVELKIVDLSQVFGRQVLDYFVRSYFQGRTPNPCVVCNPVVKCGYLLKEALALGCEALATGHYVRLRPTAAGLELCQGRDGSKDQSYFLCGLSQAQLARLSFPLGDLLKEEVYRLAEDLGFHDFRGKESQDVCFLKERTVQKFLEGYGGEAPAPGEVVDHQGTVCGRHLGIHRYTIGQRRGLGIPAPRPLYVVGLDAEHNRVIVGGDDDLWRQELLVPEINWMSGHEPPLPRTFTVKIRSRHQGAAALVSRKENGYAFVFTEPQRAITPGQFAVLYDGACLLGGGEIA
ncbi:MAG: tRNA 2-thiouridine(34) synthase MnmA [Deltaproteobacteria bacterium]|jgi:tRNA-specific 2-thiouridylase|nr:tRNA 2-thiouridine(34) synthase MnmA [Deltaproteobacteria bacterium]